ncbi:MAG: LysM domain-containing protein [Candidatus Doudnabacteria bacterium]|nr:LysM domain-containing protein [Candidatus Doudnabacteria bacterium]
MLRQPVWIFSMLAMLLGGTVEAAGLSTYTVKRNDGLSTIAKSICGSAAEKVYLRIARENGIQNPDMIRIGQELKISCSNKPEAADQKQNTSVTDNSGQTAIVLASTKVQTAKVQTVSIAVNTIKFAPYYSSVTENLDPSNPDESVILEAMYQLFGPRDFATAAAIARSESTFNLKAQNWNCVYRTSSGKSVSTSCRNNDRHKAWSIDCGLMQINVRGTLTCPEELWTLEGNLQAAKELRDNRGNFKDWVVYKSGTYKGDMAKYNKYSPRTQPSVVATTVVNTLTFVNHFPKGGQQ